MTEGQPSSSKRWIDEAETALNKATEALRAAWEGTHEARMSTLEAAKEAAGRLGMAIDQAIDVAKESWDPPNAETGSDIEAPEEAGADSPAN